MRSQETNTGDFAADALYYLFDDMGLDVDVAVMNGGGIRNQAVTGELTYKVAKMCIRDRAKPSCAAKVANSVGAGIMGYEMYKNGQSFNGGDGLLQSSADDTIDAVAEIARDAMTETDKKILDIMVSSSNDD